MEIVERYLIQLKTKRLRWRRTLATMTVLSLLVASGVFWNLRMTGVAIANSACCGQTEHLHTEECPMEKVLICDYSTQDHEDETRNEPTDEAIDKPVDEPADEPVDEPAEEPADEPVDEPAEEPAIEPIEESAEKPTDEPTEEVPTETSEVTEKETSEETVLDTVADLAANVFACFVVTAYAEELPEEYQSDDLSPEHIHTDECYEIIWLCGFEEHVHEPSCYSDSTADLETFEIWEASLPVLTGEWADDMVLIARSQLGCGESERNFIVADDGKTKNGITRYGQWYGNPYGDWSGMFIMFCLNYAEVPEEKIPRSPGVYNMMRLAEDTGICSLPDENTGAIGNIVFLDTDFNGTADSAVIAAASAEESITAIGGDLDNFVKEITLAADDSSILGYINVHELQQPDVPEAEKDPDKDIEPEESPALLMNAFVRAATDSVGGYLTPVAGNLWQIVEGGYVGREETNKQDYGNVHIQKNVVPTDVENEFLVYLSISKQLSWKTVFDYGAYFASSANGSVGEIVSTSQGNPQALSVIQTGIYKTPFYMIIQVRDDSHTQLKFETDILVRYTNKGMKNGKILLQVPGTEQAIVVANVDNYEGTTADDPVYIQLTESQLGGSGENFFENFSTVDTVLDTVVDEMGDDIEFIEVVAGDYERTPTYSDGTLIWYPKTAAVEAGQGTGQSWQNNAAQLVYKIRLKNDRSCGACLDTICSVDSCEHVYPANKSAVLRYHMSDTPGTTYTAEFPVPYVRGLLYDIHFIKIDQDSEQPLPDAVFQLAGKSDPSFPDQTVTSGRDGAAGEVTFTDLPSGTYTLTELTAPKGYEITFGDSRHSMDIVLSYTAAPENVMQDIFNADMPHTEKLMYKGAVDGVWKVSNKCTDAGLALPSTGGIGITLYMLCGLIFVAGPLVYIILLKRGRIRGRENKS